MSILTKEERAAMRETLERLPMAEWPKLDMEICLDTIDAMEAHLKEALSEMSELRDDLDSIDDVLGVDVAAGECRLEAAEVLVMQNAALHKILNNKRR